MSDESGSKPTLPNWPDWAKPASKGDVITAMAYARVCIVDVYVCLSAIKNNDMEKLAKAIKDLDAHDDQLVNMIDRIGGAQSDG